MNLFLDIEGTLIESMDDQTPTIYFEKIREFVKSNCKTVWIFSYAIYNEEDMPENLLKFFQESFGVEIIIVPKMELYPIFQKRFGVISEMDFFDFSSNKQFGFQLFGMEVSSNEETKKFYKLDNEGILLIDDRVEDSDMTYNGFKIQTVRVT